MSFLRLRVLVVAFALAGAAVLVSGPAPAEASAGTKDDARRFFKSGQKAFASGRFEEAARAFEEAFRLAPHSAPLINAGDSYEKGGDLSRAARAYQRVLDFAEASEQDRQDATDRLAKLSPKLAVIQLEGPADARVRIDEEEFRGDQRVYVTPGEHDVTLLDVPKAQTKRLDLAAGTTRTVRVDSLTPIEASEVEPVDRSTEAEGSVDERVDEAGGIRALTLISLGVGVAAGGAAVYFGLQVNDAEKSYNAAPNRDDLDRFEQNKLFTNVSLGVSAVGLGLGTYLLVKDLGRKEAPQAARRRPTLTVVPTPSGAFVLGSGRF